MVIRPDEEPMKSFGCWGVIEKERAVTGDDTG